jgi:hypothetical protein
LNVGEAIAAQAVLKYLFDDDEPLECRDIRKTSAAAVILARRSFDVLGTGLTPEDLPELGGCDGCTECERPIVTVPVGQVL